MVKKIFLNMMIFNISFVSGFVVCFKLINIFVIIVLDEIVIILVIISILRRGFFVRYLYNNFKVKLIKI